MGTTYLLTPREIDLVNYQLSIFYDNGFTKSKLPKICISDETLDNFDKEGFDKYCIDLLGLYYPNDTIIILFSLRIEAAAQGLKIKKEQLQQIVLLHEIGHWISHKLEYKKEHWHTPFYNKATEDVHEGLAQLYTWWVVDKFPELKKTFSNLNYHQNPPYIVWKKFKQSTPKALVILRLFDTAKTEYWKYIDKWIFKKPYKSMAELTLDYRGNKITKNILG